MIDATLLTAAVDQASRNIGATWAFILGLGGLAVGGGGAVSLYKARSERSKNDADASKSIAEAATALIDPLRSELGILTGRVATLESEARAQHLLLVEHSVWDHLALTELRRLDVELPPIPPLFAAAIMPLMNRLRDEHDAAASA